MSKTFNNNDKNDARTLEVDRLYGGARLTIIDANRKGFLVADADAPALALAILEAAVTDHSSDASEAMDLLRSHIRVEAKRAAEAKEQAELEAEALELFKASGSYGSDRFFLKFSDLDDHIQKAWLAVARRAREMRAEK